MSIEAGGKQKGAFYKALPCKIGLIIIGAQLIVFAVIGWIYSQQYGNELSRQILNRARLPSELMSRGLLGIEALNDRNTMEELLKEKLEKGLVVGLNRIVFSSVNSRDPGKPLAEIEDIDKTLFNFQNPAAVFTHKNNALIAVTPVYGSDGRTPRFFTYLQLSTSAVTAKQNQFLLLFLFGSLAAVACTSVIILVSFRYLFSRRLNGLLNMVNRVKSGELSARNHSRPAEDELGLLQQGVNSMAVELEKNVTFLEQQVSERTDHLKTAAQLVEHLNSIHDLDSLLTMAVQQLQQRFSYYQVHIFLKQDDTLVHRAGYPEYILTHDFLPLHTETSLVARAAETGKVVVVNDVRTVTNRLREPEMPDGLSEISIPIIHEGRVLGVLDIQHREAGKINEGDVSLLRSLTGHLAVALDNVRLIGELQEQSLKLRQANEQLEERVSQRTSELVSSNIKLQTEIEERRVVEDQLRQAQKVEALGRLTGGVAHDFNNILTVILGNCDLLLQSAEIPENKIERLQQIHAAGRQAAALTNQLLAFSRQQVLMPTTLNLNDIITELQKMLKRLLGENIVLETDLAPDLAPVHVDRSQIEQILMNLTVNAADAMDGGGHLQIETTNVSLNRDTIKTLPGIQPGAYVCLKIRDTGNGISAEILERIFDPFFTTKKLGEGTGLGLSTVHGIVKQSGGAITAESTENQGTLFSIYFPRATKQDKQQVETNQSDLQLLKGSETILLVEDESMVREVARVVLSDLGYAVLEAENGAEALKLAAETTKKIDLLLTDIRMPGSLNGFDLADTLITANPQLKILFMSGYIDVELKKRKKSGFIQKPFTLDTLSLKVREVLDA